MYVMHLWDMHNRTTPEQVRINRARSNNGKSFKVEAITPCCDGGDALDVRRNTVLVHADTTVRSKHSGNRPDSDGDGRD